MFSNKFEVDKHVENCLKKITNEKERNNRSYTFAKLYYNVGEYEQTRRYVSSYLSVKPKSAEAHYLLGLALEKLGKKDAALEAYRTSLQIDPKQNNLILKVCELLANDEMDFDVTSAKYFCELAENVDPNNPSIYNLKEKLIMSEQNNPESVIDLLLKELETRPTDIFLRVRLLRNFVQNNKINEAYKHVHDIEEKNLSAFSNNLTWYEISADVLLRYKRQAQPTNLNWSFWCLLISVLDKFLWLRLDERSDGVKESSEYINQLFIFDQSLHEAFQNINNCPDKQLANEFLNHYRGQLYLHFATIIFKQAKKDLIPFKEAASVTLPLLFSSYHIKPIDLQASWIYHLQEVQKKFIKRWHQEAAFRCSQAGHTLLSASADRKSILIGKAEKHSSGPWQEQIYKKVFIVQEQRLKMSTSYFCSNHIEVNLKLPSKQELLEYDEESLYVFPDSLQHYIWVSLNNDLANMKYVPFQGLQYSVKNLNNCGAETLNLLDVQAFLYSCTMCTRANLKNLKHMLYFNLDRPDVLPEAVTSQLGTIEQNKFLTTAYKMYKNEPGFDSGEMRLILIRGIEAVRCVGRHGLDVSLLVQLGTIFAEKAEKSKKHSEIEFNDARAEIYWKAALPILEKMKNNQAVTYGTNRIFDYKTKDMPLPEILAQIDKGKLYLGILAVKRKEYEKALAIFEELKDPYASFHQAHIYKRMADHKINQSKESVTSEMRSQNIILLSKARDCFYLTLDRLREPSVDKNHPLNLQLGNEIEKIERLLSRIDPDANRNECEGLSDENVSSNDSTEHYTSAHYTSQFSNVYSSPYVNRNETRINQSTPLRLNISKKEARPSPERLDAQIRQLIAAKDTTLNQVLEQSRMMIESQRSMVDELRNFKDVVYNLSGQVDNLKTMKTSLDELKEVKRSVDDLKRSVDELQNFKSVTDMVYELKKEIQNMKKDSAKPQHSINDDLYALDDDYSEYNIGNNLNFGANPYQNYPNRMQPPIPPPSALYPHGYYPPMFVPPYGYSNLGLAQSAAALAFGAEQQLPPDLRGLTNPMSQTNPLYSAQSLSQPAIPSTLNLTGPSVTASSISTQNAPQFREPKASTVTTQPSTTMPTTYTPTVTSKAPPVNVVITSSDPLPTMQSSVSQPVLSVTIPPQHIKGNVQKTQPHNYQIPLPATTVTSTPSVLCKPTPAISTEGILSNVAPPMYSAVSDSKTYSKNLGLEIETTLDNTFPSNAAMNLTKPGKGYSDTMATIEKVLFESSGKLFVYNMETKQFAERGVGLIQIRENQKDKTGQIFMKNDSNQIMAQHTIAYDLMVIPNKDDAFYWTASDTSSGKETMEKFCLKMKSKEDAQQFSNVYKMCLLQNNNSTKAQPMKTNENKDKTNTNKLGGFVFTGSPIFKPKENEVAPQVKEVVTEDKKASPFANFSFGARNSNGASSSWGEISKPNQSLLSNIAATPPRPEEPKTPTKPESRDNSMTEEFVPTAEFKPVIPLPDMVEVKTGEENSEVIFDCRAKLLRYDSEKKEWKERGLGNMKILKEEKLIRLLMRREQVHKVCCNHQLLKSMNFQYMPNNFKVLTWCAQDFSEEVLKSETFAIRFKTEEQATDFLKCILKAQGSLNEDNSLGKQETKENKSSTPAPAPTQGFGDKFKPAKDSWECKTCYISNDAKANKCVACDTIRPSANKPVAKEASGTQAKPSAGWGDAFKPKAGSWECECCMVRNEATVLYCVSCESPKDSTVPKKESSGGIKGVNLDTPFKFNFGIGAGANSAGPTQPEPAKLESASTFKFGDQTAKPAFGSSTFSFQPPKLGSPQQIVAAPKDVTTTPKGVGSFVFGSPDDHQFEFKPRSPRKSSGPGEESDGSYVEEECDNIYFKPVIPLPDKVEVKTGEEEEEALYCHRAKLFRFVGGEWKERGVGDLKILKNKGTGKLRVLMRRDQVLKICLNHTLTSDIEYRSKDDKTWLFVAPDFSEGEVSYDQFCLRFKTPEIAIEFKEAVDKAVGQTNGSAVDKEDDSEVEFVSETTVTDEELTEAKRLQLPAKFFAYRKLPSCTCAQCAQDDEYFRGTVLQEGGALPSTPAKEEGVSAGFPIFATPKSSVLKDLLSRPPQTPKAASESSAKTPTLTTSSTTTTAGCWFGTKSSAPTTIFGVTTNASDSGAKPLTSSCDNKTADSNAANKNYFSPTVSKSGIFGTAENRPSIFGNSSDTEKKTSIFGNVAEAEKKTSIFGSSSNTENKTGIFGNGAATEKKTSIFGNSAEGKSIFGGPPVFGNATGDKASLFGNGASSTRSSIFGNVLAENKSLFGGSEKENKSVFGGGTENASTFGGSAASAKTSIFGNSASIFSTPPPEPKTPDVEPQKEQDENSRGIFNTPTSKPSGFFGDSSKPGVNLFGSANSSGGIFGASKTSATSLFGGGVSITTTASSVFGSNTTTTASVFGARNDAKPAAFGAANAGSLFGSNSSTMFGSGASFQFGKGEGAGGQEGQAVAKSLFGGAGLPKTTNLKEDDEVVLKCTSEVSFSSLAQQTEGGAAFGKSKSNAPDTTQPFAHLGVGTPVFGSQKKQTATPDRSQDDDGEGGGGAGDDEYDPHYEPIIPMPDAIVVTTGEEDETALFNERAKLYRYDVDLKEWKERGVGQFKILHNPSNNTYRFLLRREQVHKVVLNQLITANLDLQPMTTSDRAWVWAGHNFIEDEMKLEKLAVRFKYEETAKKFQECVQECLKKIEQAAASANVTLPSSVQDYSVEAVSSDSEQHDANDYDDNDYDVDYDERSMMFYHNCTLQEYTPSGQWTDVCYGLIEIYYDLEMYGAKICFISEDGEILSNSVIGINTVMQLEGNQCTWRTVELAKEEVFWRDLRAIFPTEDTASKFHQNYLQGISYAQEWEIVDDIPSAEIEELD
ncbi:E3 SUMO-protein ligase RanBP2-like isoform X2 [Coccinella septempunctata]|uniref:E3 SUMO-protein ligase RanBP2-like isoform X2 n=1 Tax=Coccinella septempunctata TaxID=41139 RepID=UPI001D095116|nr:E3 SUMO-protein ligase RanBP2-like isoform X2 [Coccinella septempunctata]